MILPLLLGSPLAGALVLLLLPSGIADRFAVRGGTAVAALTTGVAVWATAVRPTTDVSWLPSLGL
ncbi:MAG: hypothetical protein QOE01_42, partial [Actinomycetota bacterium]|nr:hypothetical protein [Actinomycetota bacterium]